MLNIHASANKQGRKEREKGASDARNAQEEEEGKKEEER